VGYLGHVPVTQRVSLHSRCACVANRTGNNKTTTKEIRTIIHQTTHAMARTKTAAQMAATAAAKKAAEAAEAAEAKEAEEAKEAPVVEKEKNSEHKNSAGCWKQASTKSHVVVPGPKPVATAAPPPAAPTDSAVTAAASASGQDAAAEDILTTVQAEAPQVTTTADPPRHLGTRSSPNS
jgi:hypothetical protein